MDTISIEVLSNFRIGERVRHRNRGQHGGNGTTISDAMGTVKEIKYVGDDFQGFPVFFATVEWDYGANPTWLGTRGLEGV